MFDTEKFICEIEARAPLYDVKSKSYSNREVKAKCWFEVGNAMFDDWDEIELAEKDERVKDLMKKWKAIRDAFVKDHKLVTAMGTGKAATSKKRYCYYDQVLFLLPYVKGNQNTSSNIDPPTTHSQEETSTQDRQEIDSLQEEPAVYKNSNVPSEPTTSKNSGQDGKGGVKRKCSPKKFESKSAVAGKKLALERSVASSAKELTTILSKSLEMQKDERSSDQFGHKAFLLSLVPVLNQMPFHTAMQLRGQISDIFSFHFRQCDDFSRSTSQMSSSSRTTPTAAISIDDNSTDNFNISDYINI